MARGPQQPADPPTRGLTEPTLLTAELIKPHSEPWLLQSALYKAQGTLWKIRPVAAKRSNLETIINRSGS